MQSDRSNDFRNYGLTARQLAELRAPFSQDKLRGLRKPNRFDIRREEPRSQNGRDNGQRHGRD